jgi:replicative DNA helicase
MAVQELGIRGLQVVELHHHRKAGKDGGGSVSLDDVYGSAWLTAGAGSVIYLQGEAGATHVKLRHLKPPNDPVGPLNLVHDHAAGTTSVHNLETDVLAYVIAQGKKGATVAEVAEACFGGAEKKDKAKANRELKKLADSLQQVPGKPGGKGGGEVPPRWRAKVS